TLRPTSPRPSPTSPRLSRSLAPPPPRSTLFPYTTLFRSALRFPLPDFFQKFVAAKIVAANILRCQLALHHHLGGDTRMISTRLRSEEHTSELQSRENLVCRLLLEKKKAQTPYRTNATRHS